MGYNEKEKWIGLEGRIKSYFDFHGRIFLSEMAFSLSLLSYVLLPTLIVEWISTEIVINKNVCFSTHVFTGDL